MDLFLVGGFMKFKIITLGCKVNTYESNVMSDSLKQAGYQEVGIHDEADIILINTCTVTNQADSKSMKMIHHARRENESAHIIVVGCMSQIRVDEVKQEPGVAIVLGNKYKSEIPSLLEQYLKDKQQIVKVEDIMHTDFESMKLNNFNRTRAFVKIEDGCDNFCSYCIIPYSRGNVRSKDPLDVLDEVKMLVKMGHHEIVLTGIHTGHYGAEFSDYHFADLLENLIKIEGLERLRISSIEMNEITDQVLNVMKNSSILVDHMHIPLQSGSDTILKLMNRKYNKQEFIDKIKKIRAIRPNISITTDLIVGFPGETDELFLETVETIKTIGFSKIHVFPYSERRGTKASKLKDMNGAIKKKRVREILELSKTLEQTYMEQFINLETTFIPEVEKDGYLIGHTGNYLLVKARGDKKLLNEEIPVRLVSVTYPYVVGEILVSLHV